MNKEIYPQDVDFEYRVRCSKHNFKPYVYCEMCMLRSQMQSVTEENKRKTQSAVAQVYISINENYDLLMSLRKRVSELEVMVNLLEEKNTNGEQK